MGMTEKQSLINAIVLSLSESTTLPLRDLKAKVTEACNNYHITISDEQYSGQDLSTEYLLGKFRDGKAAAGMNKRTLMQYEIAIKKLEDGTKKELKDIEAEDIQKWLRSYGRTVTSVTLRGKYQLISSVFNYLYLHKYIPYNPILYVDPPKAEVVYKMPLSDYDIEKVKRACEQLPQKESLRDMAMVYFFLSTGCRVSELCAVNMEDVNLEAKTCTVHGKGRKQRPVVLSDKAVYRLKLYLETRKSTEENAPLFAHLRGQEEAMTKDGVLNMIHKLRKLAGIEKLTCHTFRRAYATNLRRRDVNIQTIAKSLGHANLNQINRYSLYDSDEMLQTIRTAL